MIKSFYNEKLQSRKKGKPIYFCSAFDVIYPKRDTLVNFAQIQWNDNSVQLYRFKSINFAKHIYFVKSFQLIAIISS